MTIRPDAAPRRVLPLAVLACLACVAAPPAAAQQQTTINFGDIPAAAGAPRRFEGDRYASSGVLLGTPGASGLFGFADGAADPGTAPEAVSIGAVSGQNNELRADSPITFDFVSPGTAAPALTSFVSFFVADIANETGGGQTYTAQAFDTGGSVLETLQGTASSTLLTFDRGGVFDIARVVFTPSGDGEGIDTLRFNAPLGGGTAAVPEPGTLALLPLAGLAVAAVRRRRA